MRVFLRFLALVVLALIPLTAAYAFGQPASHPASAPSAIDLGAWLGAHWLPAVAFLLAFLPTLITVLTKYVPKATGLITAARIALDVLSFWGNKDSPTKANVPGRRSSPPPALQG